MSAGSPASTLSAGAELQPGDRLYAGRSGQQHWDGKHHRQRSECQHSANGAVDWDRTNCVNHHHHQCGHAELWPNASECNCSGHGRDGGAVGTVVFTVDGAVQPAVALNASAVATLPSAVSDALAVGSHTIAAVYTSSSVEFGTSNATRIFSVAQAIPPTVTIAPSTTSLTVSAGSSVTDTLTLTSVGGYTGTLQFSCTNLPQNATCSFQPSTVTLTGAGGPQTVVATIQTAGGTAELRLANPSPAQNGPVSPAVVFWGSGLLTMALATKKRRRFLRNYHLLVLLALLAGSGLMIACGGGSSASQSTAPTAPTSPSSVTPAGTSMVQIAASNSGTKVQSFTVTLTVQ